MKDWRKVIEDSLTKNIESLKHSFLLSRDEGIGELERLDHRRETVSQEIEWLKTDIERLTAEEQSFFKPADANTSYQLFGRQRELQGKERELVGLNEQIDKIFNLLTTVNDADVSTLNLLFKIGKLR